MWDSQFAGSCQNSTATATVRDFRFSLSTSISLSSSRAANEQLQWFGYYFAGKAPFGATPDHLEPSNLRIILTTRHAYLALRAIRQTQGAYGRRAVRWRRRRPAEVLLIDDDSFLTSCTISCPPRGGFHKPGKLFNYIQLTIIAACARRAGYRKLFLGIPMLGNRRALGAGVVDSARQSMSSAPRATLLDPAAGKIETGLCPAGDPGRLIPLKILVTTDFQALAVPRRHSSFFAACWIAPRCQG